MASAGHIQGSPSPGRLVEREHSLPLGQPLLSHRPAKGGGAAGRSALIPHDTRYRTFLQGSLEGLIKGSEWEVFSQLFPSHPNKTSIKKKKKLFQRSPWWIPCRHQLYPPAFPKSPYSEKSLSLPTRPGEPLVLCLRETPFHNLCPRQMIPSIYHLQWNISY